MIIDPIYPPPTPQPVDEKGQVEKQKEEEEEKEKEKEEEEDRQEQGQDHLRETINTMLLLFRYTFIKKRKKKNLYKKNLIFKKELSAHQSGCGALGIFFHF